MAKIKRKKGAKKKFFEAKIPLTATKVYLYGYSPEELEGNVVRLDLSKTLRGKNLELKAKIKLIDDKLIGELISLQLFSSYIKKVIGRGVDYVEDSFKTECKDARLVIKPFMLTRKRVPRAIRKAIRENARKHLINKARINNVNELFSDVMTNKLQKELSLKIKKIYPLALCEIRTLEVLERLKERKNAKEEKKVKEEEMKKEIIA